LYEALLRDSDPRTAIAAAYVLAFFPAHAFASCRTLLDVAQSAAEHDFLRSSALISCSYLGGGGVRGSFLQSLQRLVEGAKADASEPVPLLAATAAYTLLREPEHVIEASHRDRASRLADCCLEYDILLPPSDFYSFGEPADIDDDQFDVRTLLMPDPQFPWGSLVARLQKLTGKKSVAIEKRQQKRKRPQRKSGLPQSNSFDVKPDSLDLDNVVAAVRKYHANFIGDRKNIVQATKDFAPFQPHALQAWDAIIELLDSDEKQVRWAAATMLEHLEPLDEAKVGQLIERLHANNNSNLGAAIRKQKVTAGQCQDLCDRLCRGDFVRDKYATNRDDYRSIVIAHGTDQQLWTLYEHGEDAERSMAISGLLQRGLIDESDPRAYEAAAADLLSDHFGRVTSAKFTFAKSEDAQRWFFDNIGTLPKTHRWAVVEGMAVFSADLTALQDQLFTQIEAEENPVLQAKLIGLVRSISAVDSRVVDRLVSVLRDDSTSLQRAAVVRVLGSWLASPDAGEYAASRLQPFFADDSARVRRTALDQLAGDASSDRTSDLRQSLKDPDPDNVRCAMWHLSRMRALTGDDLALLLSSEQPDRLSAETLLAIALDPQQPAAGFDVGTSAANGPLTESLLMWSQLFWGNDHGQEER
jgi:HEAT repeat protein